MTVTQVEADEMLAKAKEAIRKGVLSWQSAVRQDEHVVAVGDATTQFVLSFTRNPFEMKAHFRTKQTNIDLARVDNQRQHINPDGERIVGPHLHWFKEGFEHLEWAESIDWYDAQQPLVTLYKFLDLIHTRFPLGIQEDWL